MREFKPIKARFSRVPYVVISVAAIAVCYLCADFSIFHKIKWTVAAAPIYPLSFFVASFLTFIYAFAGVVRPDLIFIATTEALYIGALPTGGNVRRFDWDEVVGVEVAEIEIFVSTAIGMRPFPAMRIVFQDGTVLGKSGHPLAHPEHPRNKNLLLAEKLLPGKLQITIDELVALKNAAIQG